MAKKRGDVEFSQQFLCRFIVQKNKLILLLSFGPILNNSLIPPVYLSRK